MDSSLTPPQRKKIQTLVDTNSLICQDHVPTQQHTNKHGFLHRCPSASPSDTPNQTSWWPRRVRELLNHLWGASRKCSGAMRTSLVSSSFDRNVSETDTRVSRPHMLTWSFFWKGKNAHGSSMFFFCFFFLRENYLENTKHKLAEMNTRLLCCVTPCSSATARRFVGMCRLYLQGRKVRNQQKLNSLVSCSDYTLRPWRWRRNVPPKSRAVPRLYGITPQKTVRFVVNSRKTLKFNKITQTSVPLSATSTRQVNTEPHIRTLLCRVYEHKSQ
jgi:hypothetical protein